MTRLSGILRRVYLALLALYPRTFREEWSGEMEDTVRAGEEARAHRGGTSALLRFRGRGTFEGPWPSR